MEEWLEEYLDCWSNPLRKTVWEIHEGMLKNNPERIIEGISEWIVEVDSAGFLKKKLMKEFVEKFLEVSLVKILEKSMEDILEESFDKSIEKL